MVGILVLVGAGRQGVVNYMDFLNTIGADATYTSVANSYSGPTFDFNATILILPFFAIYAYPWLNAAPGVASEIRGKSTLEWMVVISSTVTVIAVTAGFASMYYAGGLSFINAALANPTLVYEFSFNFWTLAMGVSNNSAVALFLGLGWIVWNVTIIAQCMIVISRYLFAGAFDRFLPEKIAHINRKYGSPDVAFLVELIAIVFLIGGASFLYGTFVSLYGAVISGMVYFFFVGITAVVYAFKNEKGGAKALLGTSGVLMTVVFAYIVYQFLAYPTLWGGNVFAYVYVVGAFILGIIIYTTSKYYYSRRGIDIGLAYKEIPPL